MKVAVLQLDLIWEDQSANLDKMESLLKAVEGNDLVILPEMFTTGFTMKPEVVAETMQGKSISRMLSWAKTYDFLIMGSLIIVEEGQYYNRLIAAHPDGQVSSYDKRHLFTYAQEEDHYTAGSRHLVIEFKGWRIMPLVCYDLRFPIWSRFNSAKDYDVLVYVANWPERRQHAWSSLLRARAIENQSYVVGCNRVGTDDNGIVYNGHSAVVDYAGHDMAVAINEEAVLESELSRSKLDEFRKKFPFLKDRDLA